MGHDIDRCIILMDDEVANLSSGINLQWSPSIANTTGTKDIVLYSEVSIVRGDC